MADEAGRYKVISLPEQTLAVVSEVVMARSTYDVETVGDGKVSSRAEAWFRDQAHLRDRAQQSGRLTWRHLFMAQATSVLCELRNPAALRLDLLDLAALLVAWIEDLDERQKEARGG